MKPKLALLGTSVCITPHFTLLRKLESKYELCSLRQLIKKNERTTRHSSSFKYVIKAHLYLSVWALFLLWNTVLLLVLPAFIYPWFLMLVFTILISHYTTLLHALLLFPALKPAAGVWRLQPPRYITRRPRASNTNTRWCLPSSLIVIIPDRCWPQAPETAWSLKSFRTHAAEDETERSGSLFSKHNAYLSAWKLNKPG